MQQEGYQGAATSSRGSDAGGGVLSYLSLQGTIPSNLHKSIHTGCSSGTDQLLLHGTTTIVGVSKLKERWTRYSVLGRSRQRKKGDAVALFVSTNAEYVSVAVGNRIIILRKHDGYASPCGVYTSE